jgi:hypothetical protein
MGNHQLGGLDQAIKNITINKARILWNILLEYRYLIKGVVETSSYKDFRNARSEETFSPLGQLCKQGVWLPDKNGDFFAPEELFLADLPEDFETDTDEARELAIKLVMKQTEEEVSPLGHLCNQEACLPDKNADFFVPNDLLDDFETDTNEAHELAMALGMRQAEELQLADKLGIPHELILIMQRDSKTMLAWYNEQQQKKVALPSSLASDPYRRQEKASEVAQYASEKTYKDVSARRRISAESIEPRPYLRSHNTNPEGQVICQLCNQQMPFRFPNGEDYFEAYQYIEALTKEYEANHVALCPNCAAEFEHACQTDKGEKVNRILQIDPTIDEEKLIVCLDMPVHKHLRFTQKHLIDLQMAIKDSLGIKLSQTAW